MSDWQKHHDAGFKAANAFLFRNLKKAEQEFKKAIEIAEKEDKNNLGNSLNCLAVVYRAQKKNEAAIVLYERTISECAQTVEMPRACSSLGDMYLEDGDVNTALGFFKQAMQVARAGGRLSPYDKEQEKIFGIILASGKYEHLEERPLNSEELQFIEENCQAGYELLKLVPDTEPAQVLEAVDRYIDWLQDAPETDDRDPERTMFSLAALWGQQLVKALGWSWDCCEGVGNLLAVATENRSMVVAPFHFVRACMEDPKLDCTILLSFNMINGKPQDSFPVRDYNNLMESAFRIVPKPGRTKSMAEGRLPV